MKRKAYPSLLVTIFLVLSLVLSACGGSSSDKVVKKEEASKFPKTTTNKKKAIKDGVLTYGLVSDTPFAGTLNTTFYDGQPDWEIIQWFDESLLGMNKDYEIDDSGAATYKLSKDKKTITIKIKKNVNWSDGKPVTAQDLEYKFLVIANKAYTGVRYDGTVQQIVGIQDYHDGKAKNISGIKVLNDKEVSITFKSATPTVLTGLNTTPLPKHYFKGVAIKDMAKSTQVRKAPIGFGPFKVKKIVPGESVELVRNDNYWRGKPKLKSVIIKVVSPKVIVSALKKGEIDVASVPVDQYPDLKTGKNYQILGSYDLAYSYIGFKLGKWDAKKGENIMNPKSKMNNKNLRQAMGLAINFKEIGDKLYNGLYEPANSLIPPSFPTWYDSSLPKAKQDVKKAKKLLDEAGYKDVNKDGIREDPKGKKLTITFSSMSGSKVAEPLANYYIQSWKKIGLNVKLLNGRLQEFNSFYDNIEKDDPKIDVYAAAWATGTDVDPSGLYGKTAQFDMTRWTNSENDKLLTEGLSPKAFDKNYRKSVYKKWQELMKEESPVIPTFFRYQTYAVNKRVKDWTIDPFTKFYKVSVTSNKSVK
ncbi:oligopeptide ABC transporter substrate-binding protein [Sporolactobacillus shoreicorticis]|uniref:Oligopeptide ABC transporter substrate-binding protein n=1 Tax=Sporolactobacillus shoreicorticis TaxID=1923877 RepID=A0ABW5S5G5_9BACL|nr:oligopeptide ABC transporter substrate-binding protein [Sporolactobacillus shoreicorticis]MCO7126672.1 oligopeptide ABC transporter substrate-binding protein [Sporolactobacillus shoreicorticis]